MAFEFALFDSPIGRCGAVWGPAGLRRLQLPEARELATRARLLEHCPEAREAVPPPEIRRVIAGIDALLTGMPNDLAEIELDMQALPPFHCRVYDVARHIPPGTTRSYGELALELDAKGAARAVGQALGRNPFAIIVPCHRVFAAGGKVGGFSANGGITTKLRLLALEAPANALPDAGGSSWAGDPGATSALASAAPILGRPIRPARRTGRERSRVARRGPAD